jgi:NTP pyrophosphatase (non-canonical NTP hydrolase)
MVDAQQLIQKTRDIRKRFEENGAVYSKKDRVLDAMEELGELAQAVLISEGTKVSNDPHKQRTKADIADALADILFALVHIADDYEIDFFAEYEAMLKRLQTRLDKGEFTRRT